MAGGVAGRVGHHASRWGQVIPASVARGLAPRPLLPGVGLIVSDLSQRLV